MTRIMISGARDNLEVAFGMIRKYLESPNEYEEVNFKVEDHSGKLHELTFKKIRTRFYKSRKKQPLKFNHKSQILINTLATGLEV